MQRNPQRAGGGGIPVVAPACKWTAEGVRNTIVSISRRKAYVSCHGYAGIQLSAQTEKRSGSERLRNLKNRETSKSERSVEARVRGGRVKSLS